MNELLQEHGCSNVFTIPEGLKELMADISREVLRDQPVKIFDYIANYLSVMLITREHGILAVKILDDLCDCKPSLSEHLLQLGLESDQAQDLAQVIKQGIEEFQPVEGKEKLKESQILKKILQRIALDEDKTASVLQVVRNAYRDYWYRKMLLEKHLKMGKQDEPWEIAAERTLNLYKRPKPSFSELNRATKKIQAAYKGYYVRRNMLHHLRQRKPGPKVDLPGPPLDIAGSREIDLGPVVDLKVREEDTRPMFDEMLGKKLGISYDPMKTITHEIIETQEKPAESKAPRSFRFAAFGEDEEEPIVTGVDKMKVKSVSHASDDDDEPSEVSKSTGPKFAVEEEEGPRRISFAKAAPAPESVVEEASEIPEELPEAFEIADDQDIPEDIPPILDNEEDEYGADYEGEEEVDSVPSSAQRTADEDDTKYEEEEK